MIPRLKHWLGWPEFRALLRRNRGAVEQFEREFAQVFGAEQAVAFPHGRSALWAFLHALGIREAEVVIPAYTCSVVAHAIHLSGNQPRFLDIPVDGYNIMNLDLLQAALNERTRAVIADNAMTLEEDSLEVGADLRAFHHELPTPARFLILHLLNLTVMRAPSLGEWVKRMLVRFLVTRRGNKVGSAQRCIRFAPEFACEDHFSGVAAGWRRLSGNPPHSTLRMASRGYWQRGDDAS